MSSSIVLADICSLVSNKVDVEATEAGNYVSTENMVTNRGGVRKASSIPISGSVTGYKCGDVLVSNIRPYFKKIWLANRDGGASNDVLVFRPNLDIVDGRYFYYLLAGDKFFAYVMASAKGAKMPRGDKAQIMKYPVDPPDMATQRKIADILGSLDDKIELNRQMNETLEQIGQALFRHYFIDNPDAKNWERLHISDLGTVITGKTPPKSNVSYYGEDIPFLKVPDMHGNCIVTSTDDGLSVDGADSQSSKYIPPMSTCVSCIATVGEVSLSGTRMQTNQQINSIIPVSPEYTFFNYFLMRSMSAKLKSMASGATAAPNLNKSVFSYIKVSAPNRSLLCEFHNTVTPLFDKILNNVRELTMLSSARDSLMSHLI